MKPYQIESIRQLHELLELPKPNHPLISVIDFSKIKCFTDTELESVAYHFYTVALRKNFNGKMKYGQQQYDFKNGTMTFFAPHQVVPTEIRDDWALEGRWLIIHPDFLNGVPSARDIRQYNFFSYELHEALYLSEEEEQVITSLLADITRESQLVTDAFSHRIIIKLIELLLSYCDRFYHRQFLTRRQAENQHLVHFEQLLDDYLDRSDKEYIGIPSVSFFAEKLRLSANYLSDMLRSTTGQSATNTFSRS